MVDRGVEGSAPLSANVSLFVDRGGEFHAPSWQVNNDLPIQPDVTMVFDVFVSTGVTPLLAVQSQGAGQGIYVTAIDGVVQNQDGNGFWWVYFVNGAEPSVGANAYVLNGGDSIAWDYKHFESGFKQAPHLGL
jgi:hypothetical protein